MKRKRQTEDFTDPIWKKFDMANQTDGVRDPMWRWKRIAKDSPSNHITEFLTACSNYKRLFMKYFPREEKINPYKVPTLSDFHQGSVHKHYFEDISDDEFFKRLGASYNFHPSDSQLIGGYLMRKINNQRVPRNKIKIVANIYDLNPEKLPADYGVSGDKQWFFFTPRDRKYENENIRTLVALDGYWKVTRADKSIRWFGKDCGFRKKLQFYKGNGDETSWIMHELRVNNPPPQQEGVADDTKLDDWIVCKIYDAKDPWVDHFLGKKSKSSSTGGRNRKYSGRKKSCVELRKMTIEVKVEENPGEEVGHKHTAESVDEGKHVDDKTSVKVEEGVERVSS
ncbi:NAC domain-containing protein [Forsythia ovata]|uniref:NAC domain-containing protein n=1 Tax=Forsythia ovata TaxID=205694 RepID=A0ABD1QD70_9LAMI